MATKRAPVTDSDIQAIVRSEILGADGQSQSQLSIERGENMDMYQGKPMGNEIDGRSSVISCDLRDTVEWILPSIMRIFTSGEDAVEFEPQGPEDVQVAKQATDYVNYIWNKDNRGYLTFYSWFKDALLQKNGIVKIWYDDTPQTKRERYSGLDDETFAQLVNDDSVEVSEHTETEIDVMPVAPDGSEQPAKAARHDVVITRTLEGGRVRIVPVPPEEFLISKEARSIEDARFVGHRRRRTISDLIEEGYSRDKVEMLSGDETSIQTDAEEIKRNTVEYVVPLSQAAVNPAMRQIWVTEGYIRADVDGDGIAEMRKVVVAGSSYEILSNEAWDTPRPFASVTPIIMPHRFWGLAVADLIKDIQVIKSTILRQYLDNLYLSVNPREEVDEARIVDPSEVLSSAPGRKIRVRNGNGPAVRPIPIQPIGPIALEGLNYIDQIREGRTGVSQRTQGLASNQLHDTAQGERMLMSAAMGKIELIARTFAETGVRDAFRLILKLVCMYQNKDRVVRLRNEWVPMDPSQWNSDMDLTVQVAMGMGDKDQQLQHVGLLMGVQKEALPMGWVTPDNLKNSTDILVSAMGFKGSERFFTFPQPGQPGPQQPPNPEMVKVQGQLQLQKEKNHGQLQLTAQKQQITAVSDAQKSKQNAMVQMFAEAQKAKNRQYQIDREIELKAFLGQIEAMYGGAEDVHMGGEPG